MNKALRNHGKRRLEPFLPYMKLLLSALYQVRVRVRVTVRLRLRARVRVREGLGLGILEPFLPYMKLLLSALYPRLSKYRLTLTLTPTLTLTLTVYQLPLVQVPTYRGVKRELFEASGIITVQK